MLAQPPKWPAARLLPLLTCSADRVQSCLSGAGVGMHRALLEVMGTGAVATPSDVEHFINCTLLAATQARAEAAGGGGGLRRAASLALPGCSRGFMAAVRRGFLRSRPT